MINKEQEESKDIKNAPVLGVSDQLRQEFQILYDTCLSNGVAKYSKFTVDTLAATLVCRKYSNICFEFTHFVWIILHSNGLNQANKQQLLYYFWCKSGHHKTGSKSYFENSFGNLYKNRNSLNNLQTLDNELGISITSNMSLNAGSEAVSMKINDYAFSIHYSRANLLSCFIEWLILVIPSLLSWLTDRLVGNGVTAIKETSNELQKQVYSYLGKHLVPLKLQKRYQAMSRYYGTDPIDCALILSFWRTHKQNEGCTKFSSVVDDSLAYHIALESEAVYQSQRRSESIDVIENMDATEQDSIYDIYLNRLGEFDLESLEKTPKVLNSQQLSMLDFIFENQNLSIQFPATYLRLKTFTSAQSRIIQAVRARNLERMESYIVQSYGDSENQLIAINQSNLQALMAIFVIISKTHIKQACILLFDICKLSIPYNKHVNELKSMLTEFYNQPDSFLIDEKVLDKNQIKPKKLKIKAFNTACEQWRKAHDWFDDLMKELLSAYKSINRSGFTDKTQLTSEQYQVAIENIIKLNVYIIQMLNKIKTEKLVIKDNYQSDRHIFINEFKQLYLQDENIYEH